MVLQRALYVSLSLQGEKSCPYYMQKGMCRFGVACKFHHPQTHNAQPTSFPFGGSLPVMSLPPATYEAMSRPQALHPQAYSFMVAPPQGWSTFMVCLYIYVWSLLQWRSFSLLFLLWLSAFPSQRPMFQEFVLIWKILCFFFFLFLWCRVVMIWKLSLTPVLKELNVGFLWKLGPVNMEIVANTVIQKKGCYYHHDQISLTLWFSLLDQWVFLVFLFILSTSVELVVTPMTLPLLCSGTTRMW